MERREKEIYKVTLAGSAVNVLLTAFKFVAGILGHSAAMTADAIHSLSDMVTDALLLVFVHVSSKPADRSHEYGHGKFETLATALIGMALVAVAGGIFFNAADDIIGACHGKPLPVPGMLALWAAILSILLKEAVYRYTVHRARGHGSWTPPPWKPTPCTTAATPSPPSARWSVSAELSCWAGDGPSSTRWPRPWSPVSSSAWRGNCSSRVSTN